MRGPHSKKPPYTYPLDRTNDRHYPDGFEGTIFVWDIDKTYLASEIDSLRGLLAIPLEFAVDKRNVAGTGALLRAIRHGNASPGQTDVNPIYFVSASPPQLRRVIERKMLLDGVEFDGITFKDQLALVRRGKFGKLREQIGYKLSALLLNRRELPWTVRELLFGDDSEADALIYSIYGDVVAGRLRGDRLRRTLLHNGVRHEDAEFIVSLTEDMPTAEVVAGIFINLENKSEPSQFADFDPRVLPCTDTFQMALRLYEDGYLTKERVLDVAATLVQRYQRYPPSLLRSAADLVARGGVGLAAINDLWDEMVTREIAPDYFKVDASRIAAHPAPSRSVGPGFMTPARNLAAE